MCFSIVGSIILDIWLFGSDVNATKWPQEANHQSRWQSLTNQWGSAVQRANLTQCSQHLQHWQQDWLDEETQQGMTYMTRL